MVAILLAALSFFGIFNVASFAGVATSSGDQQGDISLAAVNCPDTGLTSFQADLVSKENTTGREYLVNRLDIYPVENGAINVNKRQTYTSSATVTRTAATSVACGAGKEYRVYANVQRDNSTGLYGAPYSFNGDQPLHIAPSLKIDEVSSATGRVYDLDENAFVFSNESLDGTNTAYEALRFTAQSTTNNTAKAIGAGGTFNWKIQLAAATADTVYGGASGRTWACVDYTPTDFDKVVSFKFNGVQLSEAKAQMHPDDQAQIATFDECFILPRPINDVQGGNDIEVQGKAKDGVNPSTDWTLRILAEDYLFDQDEATPVLRVFRKSDGRQEMGADVESITFDFS